MLRMLVRTPRRRLAWQAFAVALAWVVWAMWPPAPEVRWGLLADEGANHWFTPDGQTVLTVRRVVETPAGGSLRIVRPGPLVGRDAETGRERYRLLESVGDVGLVEMTPDGRRLTVQTPQGGLIVLDPVAGRQLAALAAANPPWTWFNEHVNPVSPDGRWLAYAPPDSDVRLFDLTAGHDGPPMIGARPPMTFSPDGRILAAQTADRHLGFWDVATGAARPAPADGGPEVPTGDLCFAPDGRTLAAVVTAPTTPRVSGPWREKLAVWDVATGARRAGLPLPGPDQAFKRLNFSTDGRFLAIQTADPDWLWDLTAEPPAAMPLGSATVAMPARWSDLPPWTPDGTAVLAAGGPRELALFDPATRERRQTFRFRHEPIGSGQATSFSPDGRTLLVGYQTPSWLNRLPDSVQRWLTKAGTAPGQRTVAGTFDVATGRRLRAIERPVGRWLVPRGFTPDGRSFWTVTYPQFGEPGTWVVFERWSVEPPGPPWWLLGLTAAAVGLAVVDRFRRRGAIPPEA